VKVQKRPRPELEVRVLVTHVSKSVDLAKSGNKLVVAHTGTLAGPAPVDLHNRRLREGVSRYARPHLRRLRLEIVGVQPRRDMP
jgi:hypothetical protein